MTKLNERLVCNECNTNVSINAVFCAKCGNQLFYTEHKAVDPQKIPNHDTLSENSINKKGLSESNSSLIAGTFFVVMLLYGGDMFSSVLLRIFSIILIPIALWWGLFYWGKKFNMGVVANDRLSRVIWGLIGGALIVLAIFTSKEKYHTECTNAVQSRDDIECIGDYITVKGPDQGVVVMELAFACIALYMAFSKKSEDQS